MATAAAWSTQIATRLLTVVIVSFGSIVRATVPSCHAAVYIGKKSNFALPEFPLPYSHSRAVESQPMTIRGYIKRRFHKVFIPTLLPVLIVLFWPMQWSVVVTIVLALLIFVGVAIVSAYMRRSRCPRCSNQLGNSALAVGASRQYVLTRCPHCSVSFDEPLESPASRM